MTSFHEFHIKEKELHKYYSFMPGVKRKPNQEIVVIDDKLCMTTCNNCSKRDLSVACFAPKPSNNTIKQFTKFVKDCEDGNSNSIRSSCSKLCKYCRETNTKSKSQTEGEGKQANLNMMAIKIKDDMQERGCKICGCFDIDRLQADHPNRKNKRQKVQDARNWKTPDDMWNEYLKCDVLCSLCHVLQSSHNADFGADTSKMPDGPSTSKEYQAKYSRLNRDKMQDYNNRKKRETGACKYCDMEVTKGIERAFDWAHRDERTKVATVSKLCENTYNEKNLKKIDDEIAKCDLLCNGCHKQFQTQEHYKEFYQQWDELIERGVPKPKDWDQKA